MRMCLLALMTVLAWPAGAHAQELAGSERQLTGTERQRVLEGARSRYYSLTGLGVESFTCMVKFDLGTISKGLLPESDRVDRALLESAVFVLKETPGGPTVRYQFPQGSASQSEDVVRSVTLWISELVHGFFEVWPGKGFNGPIPPDKQVQTVGRDGEGFRMLVKSAGGSSELGLDRDFLVREIVSRGRGEEIVEHPRFTGTPDGLVFSGNETDDQAAAGVTRVRYEIEQGNVDGLRLPLGIHLVVGEHVDVRFGLSGCRVEKRRR